MEKILKKLKAQENLNQKEAYQMQEKIISGKVQEKTLLEIFRYFNQKKVTDMEFSAIVKATRDKMLKVKVDFDCLDTCGTGGDGLNTFNISTISAIICAALDIPVAKHGNRAASSQCGSADVLEELGIKVDLDKNQAKRCLDRSGIVFLFAPNFHPALKFVKQARIKFAKPTYFNILGPMLNPVLAKYQLIGINDKSKIELMGKTLINTGSKRVMIVYGKNGMDELSVEGENLIYDFSQNKTKKYSIGLKEMIGKEFSLTQIKGGDQKENAKIFLDILNDKASQAQKAAACLNAGCALFCFGKAQNILQGVYLAKRSIEKGKALKKFKQFKKISNAV
ncbi:MAG: anthranilate phosphoribosyltransferase [Candidatus Moranbacteria bacterium]|nr:anthranilate phosphoribosyltransferase [Candidatus Moranbacteria bacterium]